MSTSAIFESSLNLHTDKLTKVRITQEQRQEQMRKVCQNHYKINPLNLERDASQALQLLDGRFHWTYFNDDFKFMLSFIHKIGSSNWLRLFQKLHRKGSQEFRKRQRDPLWTLQSTAEFPKSEKQLVDRLLNFTKVIFVRHPLSRLLSAYRDKFVNLPTNYYRKQARLILEEERGTRLAKRKKPNVTFSEFANFITNEKLGILAQDSHWSTIVDKYRPCECYFDFIGHLETVEEDTEYLFRLLHIDDIVSFGESRNPTQSSSKILLQKHFSQLSEALFQKIVLKYEDDFRVFGYYIPHNASDL